MEDHIPVLLQETINSLSIRPTDTVFEGTVGLAGHSQAILKVLQSGTLIGVDSDKDALEIAEKHIFKTKAKETKIYLREDNYRNIEEIIKALPISALDAVLLDLGWGSHHLMSNRGFSFKEEGSLDMCYSRREDGCVFNAHDVVNTFDEENLREIIWGYGEERWATRIAKYIIDARDTGPITTPKQLADIIAQAVPKRFQSRKIHPATKTFQAIRIAVNDEIGSLQIFLDSIIPLAAPGARIAIISFHSLEDRIVKRTFRHWEEKGTGKRVHKKPIRPTQEEIDANPRARSAKLRTFIIHI